MSSGIFDGELDLEMMRGQEQDKKHRMGSTPNSLSLVCSLLPNNHGDQTPSLPYNSFTMDPSSEANHIARSSNPATSSPPTSSATYMECFRNRAAALGAHILDGCGEFMPSGEEGTPESYKCAVCGCHRNFHPKLKLLELNSGSLDFISSVHVSNFQNYSGKPGKNNTSIVQRPLVVSSVVHHRRQHSRGFPTAPVMVDFGGRAVPWATGLPREDDLNTDGHTTISDGPRQVMERHHQQSHSKNKRFRAKFTREQKNKMKSFGEKLGWRIGKQDEHEVARFCTEVMVKSQVFKVWMHNSKQAMKKKLRQCMD